MEDLNSLKVTDLKAELKKRGLPVSGIKAVLIERLQEAIKAESTEAKADAAEDVAPTETVTDTANLEDVPPMEESKGTTAEAEAMEDTAPEPQKQPEPAKSESPKQDAEPPKDQVEAKVVTPPKSPVESQPPITDFVTTDAKDTTVQPSPPASAEPKKSPLEPEVGQQTIEETIQSHEFDNRKRRRASEEKKETPLSPPKRFKPSERRSRTPEPSPHIITAAKQTPAIYPATNSIYIACLSRPLSLPAFTNHLASLTPSKTPPTKVWLDPIKTHAFISFSSAEDASAVRDALNGRPWPANENRRELSVDFIPDNVIDDWIAREEDSRGQRFEVIYQKHEDGTIKADHVVTQSKESRPVKIAGAPNEAPRKASPPIPTGPRASRREEEPMKQQRHERVEVREGEKVRVLQPDELFKKTTTKPWLYWMEASEEVRDRRRSAKRD